MTATDRAALLLDELTDLVTDLFEEDEELADTVPEQTPKSPNSKKIENLKQEIEKLTTGSFQKKKKIIA